MTRLNELSKSDLQAYDVMLFTAMKFLETARLARGAANRTEFAQACIGFCDYFLNGAIFNKVLFDYADCRAELDKAMDTIAELEEALNECNGVTKVNERERIQLNITINIGREDKGE